MRKFPFSNRLKGGQSEDKMKKLQSSPGVEGGLGTTGDSTGGGSTVVKEGRSVFHTKLKTNACQPDMDETLDSVQKYIDALVHFCGAGTHLSEQFSALLGATMYNNIASQFEVVTKEVEAAVQSEAKDVRKDVETYWSQLGRSYDGERMEGESTISEDIKVSCNYTQVCKLKISNEEGVVSNK